MSFPIGRDMGRKERPQLFDSLTFHQSTQSRFLLVIEVGQLRDTDMWEVLRSQSEEAPEVKIYRFHREFVRQIQVFIAQFGEIALVECILLVILWHCLHLKESSLTHKDRLYLEEVITMMGHCGERDILCPLLEHIAIDAKAVVTGQRHEIGILPGTTAQGDTLFDV